MNEDQKVNQSCKLQIKSYISQIYEEPPEQDCTQKQQLLKNQIYNHYYPNQEMLTYFYQFFLEFAKEKKNVILEEPNLNIFSLTQLKEMIDQFTLKQRLFKEKSKDEDIKVIHKIQKSVIIQQPSAIKTFYKNCSWDYQLMVSQMNCNRMKNFFGHSKIQIKFKNHYFRKERSFFGITQQMKLWIEIQSTYLENKITVQRSIQDFIFIEKTLKNVFPHSFVYALKINKEDLVVHSESSNKKLISKCFKFLSQVTKRQQLRQNVFMFRFLIEQKYNNYKDHKRNNENTVVTNLQQFKNTKGQISVFVSKETELIKKDVVIKSTMFQRSWKNIENLLTLAAESSRQLNSYLGNIKDQFSILSSQISINLIDSSYSKQLNDMKQLISSFDTIFKVYGETIAHQQSILNHLKKSFVTSAYQNWNEFKNYRETISSNSQKYQYERKDFLQKQSLKSIRKKMFNNEKHDKLQLKIEQLNLEESIQQELWVQNKTIWYGYMNYQFIKTFQEFIRRDRINLQQQLVKISHQIHQRCQDSQTQIAKTSGFLLLV